MPSVRTQARLTRDETMRILRAHADEIRAQGVVRLALFGSTARGEARPDSDVDLLVDYDESRMLSLIDIAGISARIEELLGRQVELADRKRLKPFLKDNILAEAIEVFPRPGHRLPRPEGSPMPPRSPRQRLQDILDAIVFVQRHVEGRTLDDYRRHDMLRAAVERKIEIVSEAARRLPEELTARHADIPWGKIRGVGNILRHEYDDVYDEVVWNIAAQPLAPLRRAIEAMIALVDRREGR
jgi:uncharacterized protein